eukprot:CAMPEP_0170428490 /NCGR_PEP_ID=MMETSP0117_2-20130122/39798_1 /TAXON_ID=400756 /ORGANISM="Durinskia baltica, Strain CSIRO CS-38" /LENGTH=79 /DNA_ID=CAMNT_0010687787 /DNA_START=77 /DNA_END=312 /DNA_ORIENTATION=+
MRLLGAPSGKPVRSMSSNFASSKFQNSGALATDMLMEESVPSTSCSAASGLLKVRHGGAGGALGGHAAASAAAPPALPP